MTPTKPEDALVERLRGPFNYDPGAMQDALLEAADAITTLLERVAEAYDEGVEDGIAWHCYPESGPRPNSKARAALTQPNPDREV